MIGSNDILPKRLRVHESQSHSSMTCSLTAASAHCFNDFLCIIFYTRNLGDIITKKLFTQNEL